MSIPDVVGFDLYPLQVWCRPAFADVMDSQQELGSTSGGKPTFQWIEVAPMEHECRDQSSLDPTPDTVRAETWLAVAGLTENGGASAKTLAEKVEGLLAAAGMHVSLADCGVTAEAVPRMAAEAATQWTAQFNPRAVAAADFESLYRAAFARPSGVARGQEVRTP